MLKTVLAIITIFTATAASAHAADDDQPTLAEKFLLSGELKQGEEALSARVKDRPDDDQARYGLGAIQFLRAVEHLSQSLHRYGMFSGPQWLQLPFVRLPIPPNPNPAECSYEDTRQIMRELIADLARARETLERLKSETVKLPIAFGKVRLDLDGDGKAVQEETLWRLYNRMNAGSRGVSAELAESFLITFDGADVHWLRGYCHLLSAMAEMSLAYDGTELFERTGHIFFPRTNSPYTFLREGKRVADFGFGADIADVIAMIHLLNFPLKEPERMKSALSHLEQVIVCSRANWNAIVQETDDDHEWIPSPKQTGVIPGVRITPEMVDGWLLFLTEADGILRGDLLIPFWRGEQNIQGVNLRKVFTEPRRFDLVMWVQGTDAAPYLEKGELSSSQTWERLFRIFGGEFFGFALWFN